MNDEELIRELYKKYWEYMISKDDTSLREIMSEDYYLLHMTGVKQSVEEFYAQERKWELEAYKFYSVDLLIGFFSL